MYKSNLIKSLQERILYFKNAGLQKEAELLNERLISLNTPHLIGARCTLPLQDTEKINSIKNSALQNIKKDLQKKLTEAKPDIPEPEKRYILEAAEKAVSLKELKPLRIAYIERLLKISRAARSEKITIDTETGAGPYNNERTLGEALSIIYAQDPLWIEDLKELYFSKNNPL